MLPTSKYVLILFFFLPVVLLAQEQRKSPDCVAQFDSLKRELDQQPNDSLWVVYYFNVGDCFRNQNQVLSGLNYLILAEKLAADNHPLLVHCLTNIATLYDELEAFQYAIDYGVKAQKIAQKLNNPEKEMYSIAGIMGAAYALKKYDLVKEAGRRAFEIAQADNIEPRYAYFLLGKVALKEDQADQAIDYFNQGLNVINSKRGMAVSDYKEMEALFHEGLSLAWLQKNELDSAKTYAEKALQFNPPYVSNRNLDLANIYAANKDYKQAFELLQDFNQQKAEADQTNNPAAIMNSLLQEKFDQEKVRFDEQLEFQRTIGTRNLIIGLAASIIGFLTFLFYYNRRKSKIQRRQLKRQVKEQTKEIRKQKEKLEELDRFKSSMYTNITHEFRTPLTVILGMTEQIEGNDRRKNLIRRNSQQLLNLVNQMLDLRKLESGTILLSKVQTDIVQYLGYLTDSFKSYAETKGINIHFLSDEKKLLMDFDPEKIHRIHSNLISNAIKFSNPGDDIYLQLQVDRKEQQHRLVLKARDTGIGIPAEQLPRVFERFYQVDGGTTRQGEGTGIGLTLVAELVKLMEGKIELDSTINEGTVFTIYLPITNEAALANKQPQALNNQLQEVSTALASATVIPSSDETTESDQAIALIVEDSQDVIHYLVDCLESQYQIEIALNGKEGIDKAIELIPDLIISDVMMPIKDGFELCQTLKNDERTSHIPITLLTARADVESRIEGLTRGAEAYLSKPFHKEELLVLLQNQLHLRQKLQNSMRSFTSGAFAKSDDELSNNEAVQLHLTIEDAFLQKIRALVELDLSNGDIGINELIRHLKMSRSQIYKKVKALTDYSPTRYIRSIRLQHARRLLKTGELNVSEVGYEVGFNSPVYFSNVYFEEFGIRPNEMRK